MYNIFLLKEEKAHYKKMEGNLELSPLGVEGLEHIKKDTKVCDTRNMALVLQVRIECFCTDSKLHCTHITHTQHTHTPSAWKPGLMRSKCSAQVQTTPQKDVDS